MTWKVLNMNDMEGMNDMESLEIQVQRMSEKVHAGDDIFRY